MAEFGENDRRLLQLAGEQLKHPLVAIAHLAELDQSSRSADIFAHAKQALATIDALLLYQQISSGQQALVFEPVHVGSVIYEVAAAMQPAHKVLGSSVEVTIQHGLSPVDTDRRVLVSALQSLWQAVLGSMSKPDSIVCQAQKTKNGVRLVLKSASAIINSLELSRINLASSQPVAGLAGPSADLLTARAMFSLLDTQVTKSRTKQANGLGITLHASQQLSILG